MASLSSIKDEDLLRKMWQETEDFGRKKEIRAHMYKLREARLKEFYVNEMDSKAPITSRHGNSMADHSFESLKSNEIRGTDSPMRDIKFGPITGNTGGWNVISSSEMSDDGKAHTEKMLATTEGVTAVDGGKKAFSGKNEELKTERFDGDANNFTYSTGESSNMMLNENIVTGDENNRRTEKNTSSVSHSSSVIRSSNTTGDPMTHDGDFQQPLRDHNSSTNTQSRNEQHSTDHRSSSNESKSENVKMSQDPQVVQEAFRLAQQPGDIISRHVERHDPNTNIITEKKQLADGTIVTTKRYETASTDHVNLQATTRDNRSSATNSSNVKTHSQNVESTLKTSRDEEAFRLSQQAGNILSRDVEMSDPSTRVITEKKQLADGTVVTTKRYESVTSASDHSSGQNTQRDHSTKGSSNDNRTSTNTTEEVRQTSANMTFATARDEEAYRLSQQPGKVLSRDVKMENPTTRIITEKKELADGTIVTTKRYESVNSDSQSNKSFTKEQSSDSFAKNLRNDSTNTKTSNETTSNVNETSKNVNNQTFKTARDEEAFKLSQKDGNLLSRRVERYDDRTNMITEKKELPNGTIVTTKRYETVSSDSPQSKSFTREQKTDNLRTTTQEDRKSSQDVKQSAQKEIVHNVKLTSENLRETTENVHRTSHQDNQSHKSDDQTTFKPASQTFKTPRDEEAFRLAQNPGNVLSRDVTMMNPTTRLITEKKELTDGTIVTTRRYETVSDINETVEKISNRNNVESQNVKKNVSKVDKSTYDDDKIDRREVVEEKITKKNYDTSCACPENRHDPKAHTRQFINQERTEVYDVNADIITNVDEHVQRKKHDFVEMEKNRDEVVRREQVKKLEQSRVDDHSSRKITRELEVDSAHRAFASSLRCVTPPNERVSTPNISKNDRSQRSPSRDTTTSKISSSTVTLKKSSNTDIRKTEKVDRHPSSKGASPEKNPKKVTPDSRRSTTEIIETVEVDTTKKNRSVSPQKITQLSPTKKDSPDSKKKPTDAGQKPKEVSSSKVQPARDSSPQKYSSGPITPRDSSPHKPSVKKDLSMEAHPEPTPRESAPYKSAPRDSSPQKLTDSKKTSPRESSPTKSQPRESSPLKSSPTSGTSTPRDASPQKSQPSSKTPSRDVSPQKPGARDSYPSSKKPTATPREPSPTKSQPSTHRETSPMNSTPSSGTSTPRDASPNKYSGKPSSLTTKTTTRRDDESDEIFSSTIVIDNKEKLYRDDMTIVQTIDTKDMSATTSVSDLEYIVPDRDLITDLDSEDNIEIKINLQNLSDTEDLQIRTTIEEISGDKRRPGEKKPEAYGRKPESDKPNKTTPTSGAGTPQKANKTPARDVSPLKPGQGQDSHPRDRKSESDKKPDNADDRKKPFNRSETFEERARKLIGVASDNDIDDDDEPHYAKPTFASLPTGSRVSEIRERKAKIEKETQEIESAMTTKKKTVTSEDFIAREKTESRRTTHAYSSPDSSPTRANAKPSKFSETSSPDRSPTRNESKPKTGSKKPNETKQPHENGEIIKTNVTKTIKTTETRHASPEKKKPTTVETNKRVTADETTTTTRRTDKETIKTNKTTVVPETHITVAKITISPVRKTSKTSVVETKKEIKVAPSIRLVKRPTTDISSTEPDSDVETETDQELIKNIDKGTGRSTRKKLIQSRKDSAPVSRTTTVTSEKEKVSRSVSENVFKTNLTIKPKKMPSKDVAQPRESSPKKDSKRPIKCVTTKTINVTNLSNTINSNTLADVVIDARQAKSSREPSPNKTVPIPVKSDDEVNGHQMIYPDKVTEPDDYRKPKSKVTNIPIFEEQTKQFVGLEITEVETSQSEVIIEEDETDEHERVIINSSTLERADRKRNSIQIDPIDDDEGEDHAHLLSVSQKVNKFIETAEELKKPRSSTPFKNDETTLEDVSEPEDDSMLSVNRKVTKFSTITDETSTYDKKTKRVEDSMTRSVDEVDENLRNDECLLSVSDKVSKFITSAEKLVSAAPQKSPELVKNIMKGSAKPSRTTGKDEDANESFLTKEKVSTLTREDRSDSRSTVRSNASDITLKSTEAIKRARAVFENNTATRDIKRHDDIMSRPSVFEAKRTGSTDRKVNKETVNTTRTTSKVQEKFLTQERQSPVKDYSPRQSPSKESSTSPSTPRRGSSDSARTPIYLRDQVSTKKDLFEKRISSSKLEIEMSHQKSLSPQTSVEEKSRPSSSADKYRSGSTEKHQSASPENKYRPGSSADEKYRSGSEEVHHSTVTRKISSDKHYMSHTVASLEHVNSERRDTEVSRTSRRESETRSPTKFHRNISESTNDSAAFEAPRTPTKFGVELKRTDSGKNVQTRRVSTGCESINIEEIFDLMELEKLLEIVVGYEQRRRIRAQIRIVKKNISERKTSVDAKTSSKFTTSSYTRKTKDEQSKVAPSYTSPTRKPREEPSTQVKVSPTRKSRDESASQTKFTRTVVEKPEKLIRDDSRVQRVTTTTTTTTRTQSGAEKPRETTTTTTRTQSGAEKPREVTTKTTKLVADKSSPRAIIENLNKNSGKGKATENVVRIVKKTSATSSTQKAASTTRESRTDTDCVTSSYGVGPTDSNGLPLFGLRALKKKNPTVTTESKTTGTVVSEVSYSENGKPANVERKTMKYSTDPSDFAHEIDSDYKTSTSERKSSRGGVYSVTKLEKFQDEDKPRVVRRGSVKELKEKFVKKDSSSKITESSTKRSSISSDCEIKSSSSSQSKSFLNSEKKASNVQDVLSYMRNADHVTEDGDCKDDAEARALLNKFLGATALMTGIENSSGLSKEFLSTGSASSKNQRASSASSKVTKTVSSYSTAKSHDINDIWDVDLLKKLLESTTSYDERRQIRSRLREVMADKEACADIVKQLTAELDAESAAEGSQSIEETMTKTSSEVQQQGDQIIKTTTTEVITKSTMQPQQPQVKMSPFAKFRQLDRQNSLPNSPSPKTPSTPTTPGGSKYGAPLFTFTDPALQKKAASVKDTLLMWCQIKTKEYENVNIENFSTSWSDGLAFAALIHHFLPDAFDYTKLTPKERRHNFTLAFQIADDKAGIAPLLDVDDMVMYKKPDWKCVFCYVQSIYRRFKNED